MPNRPSLLALALALLVPASLAAQDTTDVQSLKQIRQRAGWQIDRLENLIDEAEAALDHATQLYDAVDVLVVRDSLRGLEPDTTPEPEPAPEDTTTAPDDTTVVEPDVVFDPDQYGSQQELEDDPFGVFSDVEIGGRYFLDTDVAQPGGSQSMRFDYVDQGATEQGVGRRMPLSERVREVWIEFEIRWSENFFANAVLDDTKTTFSHKLLFAQAQATATSPNWETSDGQKVSRWPLLWPMGGSPNPPNASIGIASPRRVDGKAGTADPLGRIGVNAAETFDGEWHTIRMHLRHDPGLFWLEVDGEVLADVDGFTIHPEVDLPAILVGRNKVTGNASGTESLWWGEIKAWIEDPGWGGS